VADGDSTTHCLRVMADPPQKRVIDKWADWSSYQWPLHTPVHITQQLLPV